jgi:hypothetical protein
MGTFVKLFDTVTITSSSIDNFKTTLKDNIYMPVDKTLRVDIVITHAGRLTRNHGFYLPQKMRDGVSSLLENYGKPILTHHNSHDDPVGRVVDAKYIDTSMGFARDSAIDSTIKDLCKPGIPFVQSLSLIDKLAASELLSDPAYPGLGHILITAEITDPDAIEKILDKRFLTVSIGATSDRAICSICKRDWVEEGPCEHTPGKEYEDALAYIIAGKLNYDEVSFVNVPADTLARVVMVQNGTMQDSIVVEESQQICNVNASFYFTDSSAGGTSMSKVQKTWDSVSKLVALKDSKEEDKIKALTDFLEEFKEDEDACIQEAKDKLAELTPAVIDDLATEPIVIDNAEPVTDDADAKTNEREVSQLAQSLVQTILAGLTGKETPNVQDNTSDKKKVVIDVDIVCEDCKVLNNKLAVLRQELKDICAEFDCAQQAHIDNVKNAKIQLADALIVLDRLGGKQIEDLAKTKTDMVALPLEDLLKKTDASSEALDLEAVLAKVNDGMTQVPADTVDDPTLADAVDQDPSSDDNKDPFKEYRDKYIKIKEQKGFNNAGAYIRNLVSAGLVPNDFNPENEGGSA